MTRGLLIVTLLWWLGVGAVIVEHNLAPFGRSTLRWNNPTRTTAHFAWHQRPTVQAGKVVIPPGETRRFSVTLPRGFKHGDMWVFYRAEKDFTALRITAEARPGKNVSVQAIDSAADLTFEWTDLSARGRTFDFSLTSTSAMETISIEKVYIKAWNFILWG